MFHVLLLGKGVCPRYLAPEIFCYTLARDAYVSKTFYLLLYVFTQGYTPNTRAPTFRPSPTIVSAITPPPRPAA